MEHNEAVEALVARMEALLAPLVDAGDPRRYFLTVYLRTTRAVAAEIAAGSFADPPWAARWDVAFADLYLDAVEQWGTDGTAPGPWRAAFAAAEGPERLPPVRHVLLGMNAHINFDLPQALLAVISDEEFDVPALVARRQADHERIDEILASRVAAEDRELRKEEGPGDRRLLDRLLTPWQRRASRTFLKEGREKVWRNALVLSEARRRGHLDQRLAELEVLCTRRIADLRAPGQVVPRLARDGFGVELAQVAVSEGPSDSTAR